MKQLRILSKTFTFIFIFPTFSSLYNASNHVLHSQHQVPSFKLVKYIFFQVKFKLRHNGWYVWRRFWILGASKYFDVFISYLFNFKDLKSLKLEMILSDSPAVPPTESDPAASFLAAEQVDQFKFGEIWMWINLNVDLNAEQVDQFKCGHCRIILG